MTYEDFKTKCSLFMDEEHYNALFIDRDDNTKYKFINNVRHAERNLLSCLINDYTWSFQDEGDSFWRSMCDKYLDVNVLCSIPQEIIDEYKNNPSRSLYHERVF